MIPDHCYIMNPLINKSVVVTMFNRDSRIDFGTWRFFLVCIIGSGIFDKHQINLIYILGLNSTHVVSNNARLVS